MHETRILVAALVASVLPWVIAALATNWFTADHGTLSGGHGAGLAVLQLMAGLVAYSAFSFIDRRLSK